MKTSIKIIFLFLLLGTGLAIASQKVSAQEGYVSFQVFYDELSPYGTWLESPDYGYVWAPNVAPGFVPYATDGYWVYTDQGWTWVSYYAWGWAPFHYGRWYTDPYYGPVWVPDNEWGPGWVTWRRSEGYYGWAPLGPGVNITIGYSNDYNIPYNHWTFVRERDFGRRNINNYYINTSNNITIINNSHVINNIRRDDGHHVVYHGGPDRSEVERHIGKPVSTTSIKESSTPRQTLNKNQLQIYRPQVQKNTSVRPQPVKQQPSKQQPSKQQPAVQPEKQQPAQQHRQVPPKKQQSSQQQRKSQPVKEHPSQPKNTKPQKDKGKEKPPHQNTILN